MRVIGLIGGMSWESSVVYYKLINKAVQQRLGGFHSAKLLMYSIDFAEIEELQRQDRWSDAGDILIDAARRLQNGGADFIAIGTNTMHKVAGQVEQSIDVPLLHVADATGAAVQKGGLHTVALLGTKFTMEQDFYKLRLAARFDLNIIVPEADDREIIHEVIYQELCRGKIVEESKSRYLRIIDKLIAAGAEGIVLGCTEIGLLLSEADIPVPSFDTTRIHAEAAVDLALA